LLKSGEDSVRTLTSEKGKGEREVWFFFKRVPVVLFPPMFGQSLKKKKVSKERGKGNFGDTNEEIDKQNEP